MVRRKHIRSLVENLLADQDIRSAPVPVEDIATSLGVEVQPQAGADELSGFLYRDRERKLAIIGVNAHHHPNRRNFTVAHELGHYLLHEFADIHVDRKFRDEKSSQGTDMEEREANLFAAELLMPSHFLAKDIEELDCFDPLDEDVLQDLATKYEVSTQAMNIRLAYLGYLKQ